MRRNSHTDAFHSRKGSSFVELTVSVLIIGILAAIVSPIYSKSLLEYRADTTAQRVVQDIEQTRRVARQTNASQSITFKLSDHSYTISGTNSLDRASQPYSVSLDAAPYKTQFVLLATAAQPTTPLPEVSIVFDRFGMPNQGILLTIGAGTTQKQIEVAPLSGRVNIR